MCILIGCPYLHQPIYTYLNSYWLIHSDFPSTFSVSPCYSVIWLGPLPLHHIYRITTLPCHCITASPHYHVTVLPSHHMIFSPPDWYESDLPRYHISQSFDLAPCHPTTFTMSLRYHVSQSFHLAPCHPTTFTESPHHHVTASPR